MSDKPRGIQLNEVVPWGRALAEYRQMFGLSEEDLTGQILDCAGGPASFNAEITARGGSVISADPIYQFTVEQISDRIDETCEQVIAGTRAAMDGYYWDDIKSPEELGERRMAAMRSFLADFEKGLDQGRYIQADLPRLPFEDNAFDLALCSHFLFTYGEILGRDFQLEGIRELLRVAKEARIFPTIHLDCSPSPDLEYIQSALTDDGFSVELRKAHYRMQKGADLMLVCCRT